MSVYSYLVCYWLANTGLHSSLSFSLSISVSVIIKIYGTNGSGFGPLSHWILKLDSECD